MKTKNMLNAARLAFALLLAGFGADRTVAQSREIPAPAQSGPVLITGATVHPVNMPAIETGWVLLESGRIAGVGEGTPPETPAERVDASGLHVYPGIISLGTTLGLQETGAVPVTHDHTEFGDMTPEVRAAVAVNPDSDLLTVTRSNGILTGLILPTGGTIAGRASVIRFDGWTWESMAILDDAGLVLSWPRTETITASWMKKNAAAQRKEIRESLEKIDRFFDDAEAYLLAREHRDDLAPNLRFDAMAPVIAGRKPVYIRAASSGQVESAVTWAVGRKLQPVIISRSGALMVAPLLRKHDVPVIINGVHQLPSSRHSAYDEPFRLPLELKDAGVRFAISTGGRTAHERNLNHMAATAAAYGLPVDDAIRSITQWSAEIIGLGDELGTLEKGKAATLIVTTGNPLEITTDTLIAYIDGRRIDLGNRQKALYAKYQEKYRQLGMLE